MKTPMPYNRTQKKKEPLVVRELIAIEHVKFQVQPLIVSINSPLSPFLSAGIYVHRRNTLAMNSLGLCLPYFFVSIVLLLLVDGHERLSLANTQSVGEQNYDGVTKYLADGMVVGKEIHTMLFKFPVF